MAEIKIEKCRQKKVHKDNIVRVRYSPTGRFLVSGDRSGTFIIWPEANPRASKRFCSSSSTLTDIWFSEDETLLFVGHQGGILLIYDLPKIKLRAEIQLHPDRSDTSTILSGTSRPILDYVVMTVCPIGSPNIYVALEFRDFFSLSRDNLKVNNSSHIQGNIIEHTTMSPNGNMIFFGDDLGFIYRFMAQDMEMKLFAEHHEIVNGVDSSRRPITMDASTGIASLALSPDGRLLASTSYSGGVQIWNTEINNSKRTNIREFRPMAAKEPLQKGRMRGVSFYPNTSSVIVGSDDGTLEIWDYDLNKVIYHTNFHEGVRSLDVSPIDSTCAIGCKDGSIFIVPWIGTNNQKQQKFKNGWLQKLFMRHISRQL
jgi:WD40 repeat protein